ncbi:urea ABC transporter ATP-binding subunit UrtE [Saccharothrix sp. 6-C]|uniref:Urea ABC transporter ATP-binding protein n=1 Tax=Saccharothrix texasensis TaxID=103734 RepID=A0A3N1H328_9PSEU|nr:MULTISPECIES: urea ABC transporter ATP-binding subunit UrtE [Saccharothrix]QQQ78394.1 urea ABC transporter ATP-binding subunit UrtE [Saccharothrix sp. 6-C]ROP36943.1 urea ABC transporter ATP-binding protein [Saccharothrix texasensis]
MLSVSEVDAAYGRARVLFGVGLEVPAGSLVCVMGRNGVGKTTLLKTVMGTLTPTAGRITFDGQDITRLPTHLRVRAGMAYVPQGHVSFPQLTAWENLRVTLEATGHRDPAAVDEALDVFPALRELLKRPAGFLSGGQRQQLAIARALITRPRLLLLDEPTEGVQPSVIDEIEAAIERLHREAGVTVLLVEQYLDFALRLADSFVVLDAGEVVHAGAARELHDEEVRRMLAV